MWQETIDPTEGPRFEGYATEIRAMQKKRAQGRPALRALHTKAHVGAVGELVVGPVPDALRAGVFTEPKTWSAYVRFSNGSPGHASDRGPDIRGIGLKLVGVPGPKLIPGLEGALTQDFLFIPVPALPVRGPDEFMAVLRSSRGSKLMLLPRLIGALGFRRAFAIARASLAMPKVRSMATARFYTAAPLCIGATAVKLALVPIAPADLPPSTGKDGLRADLVARLAAGPLRYSLLAQAWVDADSTPIEDVSVLWPEARSPWVPLGELTLPRQRIEGQRGAEIERLVESLSFDPWHALPAHRPLGAVMRARAPAYRESVLERGAAPEPTSVLAPDGS
ncbi:MAG: hypothetical protein IT385_28505 [Deltaproteobacteria bacterium]|nr:hypothetical protein [Deltaproteobacteria bacterium]